MFVVFFSMFVVTASSTSLTAVGATVSITVGTSSPPSVSNIANGSPT